MAGQLWPFPWGSGGSRPNCAVWVRTDFFRTIVCLKLGNLRRGVQKNGNSAEISNIRVASPVENAAVACPNSSFRLHPSSFPLHPSSFPLPPSAFILPPSPFRRPPSSFRLPPFSPSPFLPCSLSPFLPSPPSRLPVDSRPGDGYSICSWNRVVGVAQLVRVPDCGSGCRRFKSGHPPFLKPFLTTS